MRTRKLVTTISLAVLLNVMSVSLAAPIYFAAYSMNEGSGSTVGDSSVNGYDGTNNGASWSTAGKFTGALDFNPQDRVELGNLDIPGGALTIMMWFKADDFGISDARLISKSNGTADQAHYWMLSTIGGPKLRFRLKTSSGGTTTLIANSGTLSTGVWTHTAVVYDGNNMIIYKDGVEVGRTAKTGSLSTNASIPAWIGNNPTANKGFDGMIDEVKIFNTALAVSEIQTEMNTPIGSPPPLSEIYVDDDNAAGPWDGTQINPYQFIQDGIDVSSDGTEIIVAEGIYYENLVIDNLDITLTSTNPNVPDVVAATIIDGQQSGSVVVFGGTESPDCVLSGFTIMNGSGTRDPWDSHYYGGGIIGKGSGTHATIANCVITNNSLANGMSQGDGGGIYNCDGLIVNCIISNNKGAWEGSGGGLANCDGPITNCIITTNSCEWSYGQGGGGLFNCDGPITGCIITDNYEYGGDMTGGRGGGLSRCDGLISNCLIAGNGAYGDSIDSANIGGGLYFCNGTISNCTIVGNVSEDNGYSVGNAGGGLANCDASITNCIIWNNIAPSDPQLYASSVPVYSCIQDWTGGGFENINSNPLFADSNKGDFHLKSQAGRWDEASQAWVNDAVTSPCIDAGDPSDDYSNEPAPNGGCINMGAYGGTEQASKTEGGIVTPEYFAAYSMDEGAGSSVGDSSTNGYDGTNNGASWSTSGKFAGALDFNPQDRVELGNMDIPGGALTIMMWFKADDFGISDARLISKSNGTADQSHYWMISTISGPKLRFRLKTSNGGTTTLVANSGTLSTGVWTHAAVVYNGSNMIIYKDGVEVGSTAKTGSLSTNSSIPAWIGNNPTGNKGFDGLIDEVKIFNTALSLSEIQTEMNTPIGQPSSDTEPPTVPANLAATAVSQSQIDLSWNACSDNIAVTGYKVFRDGSQITTTANTNYSDSGLQPDTECSYSVCAYDAAGNDSDLCELVSETTLPSTQIIYVDDSAVGDNNGSSWTNAFNNLYHALAAAVSGNTILVAEGTYLPDTSGLGDPRESTFALKNGVTLEGGYAGFGAADPDERNTELYETILSGDLLGNDPPATDTPYSGAEYEENCYHVFYHPSGTNLNATAILDGFTISGGIAEGDITAGGGMYNEGSSPTVNSCTFSGNLAWGTGGGGMHNEGSNPTIANSIFTFNHAQYGGGMHNSSSNPTVIDCTFSANSVYWAGGGMYNEDSNPTVTNCTFTDHDNTESGYGSGMYNSSSSPVVTNCSFTGNWAAVGAGICNYSSNPTVTNCSFTNNHATAGMGGYGGGGMYNNNSNPTVANCTFTGNSDNDGGGGIYNWNSSNSMLTNCIFWGNSDDEIYNGDASNIPIISYCDIAGSGGSGTGWDSSLGVDAGGNIDEDPLFVDLSGSWPSAAVDWHLQSQAGHWDETSQTWVNDAVTSPCIDAGDPADDYSDEPAPNGGCINMGAYGGTEQASKTEGIIITPEYFAAYGMDEGSGSTVGDSSTNGYDGTNNGASWSTAGKFTGALDFNPQDRVELGNLDIPGGALTIMVWFKADDFGISDARLISKSNGTADQAHYWMLSTISGPKLRFRLKTSSGGTTTLVANSGTLSAGVWTHAAVVYNGSNMVIYKDGVEVGSTAKTGSLSTNSSVPAWIGNNPTANKGFDGLIDEVKIFNTALSPTEIQAEMDTPIGSPPPLSEIYVDDSAAGANDGSSWANAYNNLYDALAVAASGNTILVAQGTYLPDTSGLSDTREAAFALKNGVTLEGGYAGFGATDPYERNTELYETILSGDLNGNDGANFANNDENCYHVFSHHSETSLNITAILDGFTISGGNSGGGGGGGMYNNGGKSPAISNCTFAGNYGGGMRNDDLSSPIISNCTFTDNKAWSGLGGGGMYNFLDSNPTLTNCNFSNNSAKGPGGGIHNWFSAPTVINCSFSNNRAAIGGGMYNLDDSNPTVTDCTFTSNGDDDNYCGGMHNEDSNPMITDCTFSDNWGGGLRNTSSSPTVNDCTFSGNEGSGMSNVDSNPIVTNCTLNGNGSVDGYGGGMYNNSSSPTVTNCSFTNNQAAVGGGMSNGGSSPTIVNCTFTGNIAYSSSGGGIPFGSGIRNSGSSPIINSCIIWDNNIYNEGTSGIPIISYCDISDSGGSGTGWDSSLGVDAGGNIDVDPLFVDTSGPWPNTAVDCHLMSQIGHWDEASQTWVTDAETSPCIDVGDPSDDYSNEPAPNGGCINMGAFGGTGQASKTEGIIITPDYFAAYSMDEGSGSTVGDSSTNGYDGTNNGASWSTTGKFTGALDFNPQDRVELGNLNIPGGALTIMMWFKADDFGITDARLISKSNGTADQSHYWMLSTISGPKLRFRLKTSSGGTTTLVANSGTLSAGVWTHAAVVYDGSNMIIYKDGVEVGRTAKTGSLSTNSSIPAWIGNNPTANKGFDGMIDEVKIFNTALSVSEIQTEMNIAIQ